MRRRPGVRHHVEPVIRRADTQERAAAYAAPATLQPGRLPLRAVRPRPLQLGAVVPIRLALVPREAPGPRQVELLGGLRIGGEVPRRFHERCEVDPLAGTTAVGAVREANDALRVDLDVHGSVQADGALVVTITLQVHHRDAETEAPGIEAETTVVAADVAAPFALVCLDGHGCRAEAQGSITNGD